MDGDLRLSVVAPQPGPSLRRDTIEAVDVLPSSVYSKIWTHLIPVPQRGEIAFPPKECNPSGCKWGGTAGLLGYGASLYKSRP